MSKTIPGPDVISVRIPSRLDLLSVLDHVAVSLCERMEMPSEEASKITMSVIEAGTNAIQHGHDRDASKFVDIEFTVFPDRLEITVHDLGQGFDTGALNGAVGSFRGKRRRQAQAQVQGATVRRRDQFCG